MAPVDNPATAAPMTSWRAIHHHGFATGSGSARAFRTMASISGSSANISSALAPGRSRCHWGAGLVGLVMRAVYQHRCQARGIAEKEGCHALSRRGWTRFHATLAPGAGLDLRERQRQREAVPEDR